MSMAFLACSSWLVLSRLRINDGDRGEISPWCDLWTFVSLCDHKQIWSSIAHHGASVSLAMSSVAWEIYVECEKNNNKQRTPTTIDEGINHSFTKIDCTSYRPYSISCWHIDLRLQPLRHLSMTPLPDSTPTGILTTVVTLLRTPNIAFLWWH